MTPGFEKLACRREIRRAPTGPSILMRPPLLNITQVELPNLQLHLTDLIESAESYHPGILPCTVMRLFYFKVEIIEVVNSGKFIDKSVAID